MLLAFFAAGVSGLMAENLFGQVSYGTILYITSYLIYFSYQAIFSEKRLWGACLIAFSILIIVVFWSNPQRAMAVYLGPLLVAIFLLYFSLEKDKKTKFYTRKLAYSVAVLLVSVIVGIFLHRYFISNVNNISGAANARWLTIEDAGKNATLFFKSFIALFGGLPSPGLQIISLAGIYESCRLISAICLLVLIPISIKNALLGQAGARLFIAAYALSSFLVIIFFQIFSTIPDMNNPIQSGRYLIPPLLLSIYLVFDSKFDNYQTYKLYSFTRLFVVVFLVTSAYSTYLKSNLNSGYEWDRPAFSYSNPLDGVMDFIEKNDLKYGYATYWNAGAISALSNERVLIRQIQIDRGLPIPMRHLGSEDWYRPTKWTGRSFLLLNKSESESINWSLLSEYELSPDATLHYEDFNIYVFSQNIAGKLPDWGGGFINKINFPASTRSLHQIGVFKAGDRSTKSSLVADIGEVGFLHFGPYISVEPGEYLIKFDVHANSNRAKIARFDVVGDGGKKVLAEKNFDGILDDKTLKIDVKGKESLEFRVWSNGSERIIFENVSIVRLNK